MDTAVNSTINLILNEQQRIGTAIEGINKAIWKICEENARLPEKVRSIVREEMKICPAYQYFKRRGDGDKIDETTHEVELHKEMIDGLKERNARLEREIDLLRKNKASVPPRSKAPWYAPIFVKVGLAIAGALSAGGLGAWGVHCSSGKADTDRGLVRVLADSKK